jgi:hypothetical protein
VSWLIDHIDPATADPFRHTAEAVVVHLERNGETRRILVQLAADADERGLTLHPHQAVQPYLDRTDPPAQLLVDAEGVRPVEQ